MMEYDTANLFRRYLSPGERIIWAGRPKQGLVLQKNDTLLVPFSLMWGGFALFWNYSVWTDLPNGATDDWFFKLWGLPFLAAGIYFIVGRFFHDALIRRNLSYAVTDQRVLMLRGSSRFTSRDIRSLPMLELTEYRDGTGTLAFDADDFGYSVWGRRRGWATWTPSTNNNAQFFRISDPRRVYELIRNQAHA